MTFLTKERTTPLNKAELEPLIVGRYAIINPNTGKAHKAHSDGDYTEGTNYFTGVLGSISATVGFDSGYIPESPEGFIKKEHPKASKWPTNAYECDGCGEKAMVMKDNCGTCLNCGNSKCGV